MPEMFILIYEFPDFFLEIYNKVFFAIFAESWHYRHMAKHMFYTVRWLPVLPMSRRAVYACVWRQAFAM